jgi:2-isopropylmalate synthase
MVVPNNKPYVGESAFAHKGGMHIDASISSSRSFEHIDPALVGNSRKFLHSEVSAKSGPAENQRYRAGAHEDSPETAMILDR